MKRCKSLLFLAVIFALVTVVPVMAECTVRPKGCTQLVDGEEVYVKFWSLQDCIDIMGHEFKDSCIISYRPVEKHDGDIIEKTSNSSNRRAAVQRKSHYATFLPDGRLKSYIVPLYDVKSKSTCEDLSSSVCKEPLTHMPYPDPYDLDYDDLLARSGHIEWNADNNTCECKWSWSYFIR